MISASLNNCKKMGAEPDMRFLKQPAAKLVPVIVVNQAVCKSIAPLPIALESCSNPQDLASLQVYNEKIFFWFWVSDFL